MAIADTITSMQNHTSNAYTMIGYGTDLTGINKNLENLSNTIFEAFLEALRNPDTLFTNLPKTSASGSNITLNNTAYAPMRITLNPTAISQDGTPTPSTPQDIHTISGNNSVVAEGKNLFDKSVIVEQAGYLDTDGTYKSSSLSTYTTNYTKVEPNTTYTLSGTFKESSNPDAIWAVYCYTENKTWIQKNQTTQLPPYTFTTPANCYYLQFQHRNSIGVIFGSDVQLEKGSTATTYTPYVSQTNPINLGEYELGTIGDYKNRIFKNIPTDEDYSSEREEGAWYYKQGIGKVVLDGTRTWTKQTTWSAVGNKTNAFYIGKPTNLDSTQTCFSTHFTHVPTSTITSVDDYGIAYASNLIIRVPKSIDTNSDLQTWLSNNNPVVYYILATPTYTKITGELASQLEQVYKGMLSYDGTTNISQVNNDLPFELVASAITK